MHKRSLRGEGAELPVFSTADDLRTFRRSISEAVGEYEVTVSH